ncbi:MAG: hypothetical protein R3F07_00595 [Opitutaceae bacterium]
MLRDPASVVVQPDCGALVDDRLNRVVAWFCLVLGAGTGLVMGIWSFDGPVRVPAWLGDYGETSRRLARLGHIAFFGIGMLNLFVVAELRRIHLSRLLARVALMAMNFGNIFLPLSLFLAAGFRPLKYFMSVPATLVFVALVIVAWGVCRDLRSHDRAE